MDSAACEERNELFRGLPLPAESLQLLLPRKHTQLWHHQRERADEDRPRGDAAVALERGVASDVSKSWQSRAAECGMTDMAAASSLEEAVASAEKVGAIVSYVGAKRFLGEVYPTQYTFQWAGFQVRAAAWWYCTRDGDKFQGITDQYGFDVGYLLRVNCRNFVDESEVGWSRWWA